MNTIDLKLKKYFKGKKVFITGHTGFKGSWLSYLLHKVGAEVMGYALKPKSDNDHFCLLNLQEKINHVEGDITDSEHLNKKIINFQPDYVFHLAALAQVIPSIKKLNKNPLCPFVIRRIGRFKFTRPV